MTVMLTFDNATEAQKAERIQRESDWIANREAHYPADLLADSGRIIWIESGYSE